MSCITLHNKYVLFINTICLENQMYVPILNFERHGKCIGFTIICVCFFFFFCLLTTFLQEILLGPSILSSWCIGWVGYLDLPLVVFLTLGKAVPRF